MKTEFKTDSRVAHYIQFRRKYGLSLIYRACDAWAKAKAAQAKAEAARQKWEEAKARLSEYWKNFNRDEPKRYAPEGERLAALRAAEKAARKKYFRAWAPALSSPYIHRPAEAMAIKHAEGEYFFPNGPALFRIHEGESGYYADNHGLTTVSPVVAFLPGKDGNCRAVPGYRYSDWESGAVVLDMSDIREEPGDDSEYLWHDCMATAESIAEHAAEEEIEHQTAYDAGQKWAELREGESAIRKRILAILKERKTARGGPTICATILDHVAGLLDDLRAHREEREKLKEGSHESFWFNSRDSELRRAFNEGAGL